VETAERTEPIWTEERLDEAVRTAKVRELQRSGAARTVRIGSGLTLGEAARAVGVDVSTVHRWEMGARRPTGDRAVRYHRFLEALMTGGRA